MSGLPFSPSAPRDPDKHFARNVLVKLKFRRRHVEHLAADAERRIVLLYTYEKTALKEVDILVLLCDLFLKLALCYAELTAQLLIFLYESCCGCFTDMQLLLSFILYFPVRCTVVTKRIAVPALFVFFV